MSLDYGFNQTAAQEAKSSAGWIKTGGPREVTFKKTEYGEGNENADFLEFTMEDNDGALAKCRMYLHYKNGDEGFQKVIVDALMGILEITRITSETTFDGEIVPQFNGKKVICKFQEEEYYRQDGTIGTKVNIVNFYDLHTRKSYTEKLNNMPALDIDVQTFLKKAKPQSAPSAQPSFHQANNLPQGQGSVPPIDDDLPF